VIFFLFFHRCSASPRQSQAEDAEQSSRGSHLFGYNYGVLRAAGINREQKGRILSLGP
jgi:hypothetical protein